MRLNDCQYKWCILVMQKGNNDNYVLQYLWYLAEEKEIALRDIRESNPDYYCLLLEKEGECFSFIPPGVSR